MSAARGVEREALERTGHAIVTAGLTVHKTLGPGLLESAYEHCLAYELQLQGLAVQRQVLLPVQYNGVEIDAGYRIDLLVEKQIIIEVKAVDALSRLHGAQLLTYLRLSRCQLGYLMNCNVMLFKDGLRRFVL